MERGYAHVVKEDLVNPDLLFVGPEFGLWISVDSGKQWAQYKGGDLPSVAVRDLAIHSRDADLVIATHGRGIWIVDDITPLRKLTADTLAKEAEFIQGRPVVQRIPADGGWVNGDASFVGANPPDAGRDLGGINAALAQKGLDPITVLTRAGWEEKEK